jgi:acyl-CoA thioesterase-1
MSAAGREIAIVVALGASNTAGWGVGTELAFPAVLGRLLQARGIAVQVVNAGVPGETTGQMRARLRDAVPAGTRVVLFQPGSNDARLGIAEVVREENIRAITAALEARGVAVLRVAWAFAAVQPTNVQADGVHLTVRGHELLAEHLVDEVAAALRA